MNPTQTADRCSCTQCPGLGCDCGCHSPLLATPPACACASACRCDAASSGCLCR